jgi:hypothetical protein
MKLDTPDIQLKLFLWLIALHSFFVGVGLILFPPAYLDFFGFNNYTYCFFQAQGGVFHIVMCVAYLMASKYMYKSHDLILFSIVAKSMGTFFLILYFLFMEQVWMIIMSAIGDGVMAFMLYYLYKRFKISIKPVE